MDRICGVARAQPLPAAGTAAARRGGGVSTLVAVSAVLIAAVIALGCWMRLRRVRRDLAGLKSRLDAVLVARGRTLDGKDQGTLPALVQAIEAVVALEQQTHEQLTGESARREQAEARCARASSAMRLRCAAPTTGCGSGT